jgi:hypothetical protein
LIFFQKRYLKNWLPINPLTTYLTEDLHVYYSLTLFHKIDYHILLFFCDDEKKVTTQITQIEGCFRKVPYRNNSRGDFVKSGPYLGYLGCNIKLKWIRCFLLIGNV